MGKELDLDSPDSVKYHLKKLLTKYYGGTHTRVLTQLTELIELAKKHDSKTQDPNELKASDAKNGQIQDDFLPKTD